MTSVPPAVWQREALFRPRHGALPAPAGTGLRHAWCASATPSQERFSLSAEQLGAHTVSESAVSGWSLTTLACPGAGDDSSTDVASRTAALDIDAGESIVCTITNTRTMHAGTIGFWRNWRNHYSPAELGDLASYLQSHNQAVYGQHGNLVEASRIDAIFAFGRGRSTSQLVLAQLSALKLNLAATASGIALDGDVCPLGVVSVAGVPGATALLGTSTPAVAAVVTWVEGRWTGTLTTNRGDWSFAMTKAQASVAQRVVESVNDGSGVLTTGCP